MADIGSGEKAEAKTENLATVASSFHQNGKKGMKRTRKTVKLTLDEALQIVQESFRVYQEAGGKIKLEQTEDGALLVLIGTVYQNGNLTLLDAPKEPAV